MTVTDFLPLQPPVPGIGGYGGSPFLPGHKGGVRGGPLGGSVFGQTPFGGEGNWRTIGMPSDATTREIAISMPSRVKPDDDVVIIAELLDRYMADADNAWLGDTMVRIYRLNEDGTKTVVQPFVAMTAANARVRLHTWTPTTDGVYVVQVQGSYLDYETEPAGGASTEQGIVRTQAILVTSSSVGGQSADPLLAFLGLPDL